MRLPQTHAGFKAGLAILLMLAAGPVAGQDEQATLAPLFVCGTDPANDSSFLDLSGVVQDDGMFSDLRIEHRVQGGEELAYAFPPDGTDSRTAFLFSHSTGPEGYLVSVRWAEGGTNYVLFSLDIPPDPAVADDMGGGAAGLVSSRDGKLIESIDCAERPYMFISYMREAMSCDTQNPYGPGACGESTWLRDEPLDVTAIGIVP